MGTPETTEVPTVDFTEEQERHARKLFEGFDFDHRIFATESGSQATVTGRLLQGYRNGLTRLIDVIDGDSKEYGRTLRNEAFDYLAQQYAGRQLKERNAPDYVLRQIRDELLFVDFAVWQRLNEEVEQHPQEYRFLEDISPRELPRVPTFVDHSIP